MISKWPILVAVFAFLTLSIGHANTCTNLFKLTELSPVEGEYFRNNRTDLERRYDGNRFIFFTNIVKGWSTSLSLYDTAINDWVLKLKPIEDLLPKKALGASQFETNHVDFLLIKDKKTAEVINTRPNLSLYHGKNKTSNYIQIAVLKNEELTFHRIEFSEELIRNDISKIKTFHGLNVQLDGNYAILKNTNGDTQYINIVTGDKSEVISKDSP